MAEQSIRIGRRIAEGRAEQGLTQSELAAKIPGKSDGTQVSKWERGVNRPNDDTLERIAEILGHDLSWFLVPEPDKTETPDPFAKTETDGDGDVVERLDRLESSIVALDQKLSRLLPDPASPAASASIDELADYARALLRAMDQITGRLGRDLGKRDLQERAVRDRPSGSREDVA